MSGVIELRQYTLKPGRRDELIALFERAFVETQEAEDIRLIGTFRDADDADRFVWLRGFADMQSRAAALAAFYGGPVWKANRNAANDTMIDSDNVLLLKPASDGADFAERDASEGMVFAGVHYLSVPASDEVVAAFRKCATAAIAVCVTEAAQNTFPALPVREGENVLATFTRAPLSPPPEIAQHIKRSETLRLVPTARSHLR